MERTACVDIRALPLQLLLRAHPAWKSLPVVVVDRDKPQGLILWANKHARARHVLPGMRYGVALSLARELHGGVVQAADTQEAVAGITETLWSFSPRIEPSSREAGVFWLDASGLGFIYPSLENWAISIRDSLRKADLQAVIAVGFSRFGSYAAARAGMKNIVLQSIAQEQAHVRTVPLVRLGVATGLVDTLAKLGIHTLGNFIDLPPEGIVRRFGREAGDLHRFARGEGWAPLDPANLREPVESFMALEYPENNVERLTAVLLGLLQALLGELSQRHQQLAALHLLLTLDDASQHREEIAPATPTLDANQILGLCRLRLETLSLTSGVVELKAHAHGTAIVQQQDLLFPDTAAHDIEAAERALARIRAEFGNDAVVYARLQPGHLPEARYGWEALTRLAAPRPAPPSLRPIVRRIYAPPIPLPPRDHREPDGWLVAGVSEGPVEEVIGPQNISGGWWTREAARAYYFVRTRSGRWWWIYNDQKRRRWFLHGELQ